MGCLDPDSIRLLDKTFIARYWYLHSVLVGKSAFLICLGASPYISWFNLSMLPVQCFCLHIRLDFACELLVTNCKHITVSLNSNK